MKALSLATVLITALLPAGFSSCGSMQVVEKAKETTSQKVAQISKFSLTDLLPSPVPVVEVREKDLKEMPTGEERAMAFESKRKRSFWSFAGPVDFQEPALPEGDAPMDGSLLPPKSN